MDTTIKCKIHVMNGTEYPVLDIDRDEKTGTALLYLELQKRMLKIRINIEKCGGYDALLERGGEPTKTYLENTRDMVKVFLCMYQLEYMLTTAEDIADAVSVAREYDVVPLVREASWDRLVKVADSLREAFIDRWFNRTYARTQVTLPLAG